MVIISNLTYIEKLTLTFERMELSPGFNNLDLKTNRTHSKKSSCIIPRDIAENLNLKIMESSKNDIRQERPEQQEPGKEVIILLIYILD